MLCGCVVGWGIRVWHKVWSTRRAGGWRRVTEQLPSCPSCCQRISQATLRDENHWQTLCYSEARVAAQFRRGKQLKRMSNKKQWWSDWKKNWIFLGLPTVMERRPYWMSHPGGGGKWWVLFQIVVKSHSVINKRQKLRRGGSVYATVQRWRDSNWWGLCQNASQLICCGIFIKFEIHITSVL